MGKISLSNKASKVFWVSLFGYCLTFGAFFYNSQYAFGKLKDEMRNGSMFDVLSHTACEQMKGCNNIKYLPFLVMNDDTNKYKIQVSIDTKNTNAISPDLLNQLLDEQRINLPWYINQKIDSIEVAIINNNKVVSVDRKPSWYKSLISMFGG